MIAKVAVAAANFAIDKPYSYRIPHGMTLEQGTRVQVPFGRSNRQTEGIILSVEPGDEEKLKPVTAALDPEPMLSHRMLQLAAFIRERYFCTFYDVSDQAELLSDRGPVMAGQKASQQGRCRCIAGLAGQRRTGG